jgi:hypothetical protein
MVKPIISSEKNIQLSMFAEIEQIDKNISKDVRNEIIQDIYEKYEQKGV